MPSAPVAAPRTPSARSSMPFTYNKKSRGDNGQPCFTPVHGSAWMDGMDARMEWIHGSIEDGWIRMDPHKRPFGRGNCCNG
eukprot:scaffold41380_cov20-Tisochrysis_lutea.AAC.1